MHDTATVYQWLLGQGIPESRIWFWSHSMGTAVAIRALSLGREMSPKAVILEAPFTSLRDAIPLFPLSRFFTFLPYFEYFFVEPIVENPLTNFDSASLMHKVHTPLLFLHAEDDRIVPFTLGKKLHTIATKMQPKSVLSPKFYAFPASKGYGHKYIALDPELPQIVDNFIKSVT